MNVGGYTNREHACRLQQIVNGSNILDELTRADAPAGVKRDILLLKLLAEDIKPYSTYERMGMKRALRRAIKALERSDVQTTKTERK